MKDVFLIIRFVLFLDLMRQAHNSLYNLLTRSGAKISHVASYNISRQIFCILTKREETRENYCFSIRDKRSLTETSKEVMV